MNVAVQLEPFSGEMPDVEYRWDADTDILVAQLEGPTPTGGMTGSIELEGSDGSWLIFDVAAGRIRAVEVAVWPEVQRRASLTAPTAVQDAIVVIPARASQPGIASLEVDTPLTAESDEAETMIHFRLGSRRDVRAVRLATNLLLEVDPHNRVMGVWFLNVPPFPAD